MKTVLAGDLGGTKCRFAIVSEDFAVHCVVEVRTPKDGASFLSMLDSLVPQLLSSQLPDGLAPPSGVGIGAAGVVTADARSIVYAPNLPLDDIDVADYFAVRHGLSCRLINDGRASALGEYRLGFAAGRNPLLVLFFGTGIGVGLIVDGKPYEGATNAAGEAGHLLYVPEGRRCPCGRRGCFEAYCGGGPLTARALSELGNPPGAAERWSVDAIVAAAPTSPAAAGILHDAEVAAGALVQSLCTMLNPGAVVMGGGVLKGWPDLRQRIEARVRGGCAEIITQELQFVRSKGESDSILWGAALATGEIS